MWPETFHLLVSFVIVAYCYLFCTARAQGFFEARAVLTQSSFQVGLPPELISEVSEDAQAFPAQAGWYRVSATFIEESAQIPIYDRSAQQYLKCHQEKDLEQSIDAVQSRSCRFFPNVETWFTSPPSQSWRFGMGESAGHLQLVESGLPRPENAGDLFLSEILWMGSYRANTYLSNDEWIELYNPTDKTWSLRGLKLTGVTSTGTYSFPPTTVLGPYSYLILGRKSGEETQLSRNPDVVTSGLSLNNTRAEIQLISWNGQVLDETPSGTWQIGVNNTGSQTRCATQRKRTYSDGKQWESWQTCAPDIAQTCHPYPRQNWKSHSEKTCGTPWQPSF